MTTYAAVVLYFRAGAVLGDTLDGLLGQSDPPSEVIVVDNASDDGVADPITRERPGVRLLRLDRNEGYAGGMNRGVQALRSEPDHLLFLTHEAGLAPSAAREMLKAAESRRAAACGPLLERRRDGSVWSAGGTLSARGETGHLRSPRSAEGTPYEVDWLDGAVLLISRTAFARIGGFDERFFLYWEDVDISLRLRAFGPVLCAPRARAAQETGMTPPYWASRNRILLWRAHGREGLARRAALGELWIAIRTIVRKRPRPRDALAHMLGVIDGLTGLLHPRLGRLRTAS